MQTHAERETADRNQAQRPSGAAFQFADRRPETAAQNRLQNLAQSGPQAAQLRAVQARADAAGASRLDALQPETVQRQAADDEEPLQGKFEVAQRAEAEDEEPVQGKFEAVQRATGEEDESE